MSDITTPLLKIKSHLIKTGIDCDGIEVYIPRQDFYKLVMSFDTKDSVSKYCTLKGDEITVVGIKVKCKGEGNESN